MKRNTDEVLAGVLSLSVALSVAAASRDVDSGGLLRRTFHKRKSVKRQTSAWLIVFLTLGLVSASAEPKRVLLVQSFAGASPPFAVHSTAFETALKEKMGQQVDLDEVSLDMARYAEPEMQKALVDYLKKRQITWQPDLIVPIGAPAGIFVDQYRDQLFANTPVLYTSLDRQLLPPHALDKNATYIGQEFKIPELIDDMLTIAPQTKNIAVIVGTSPLEKYWEDRFRRESQPFQDRITFSYFSNLTFDQMLDRAAKMPPNSFLFLLLLVRDAAGVTHNADEELRRLHSVSNAPINSIFQHQMGLGIVGGRLYQGERIGSDAADLAIHILSGVPAASFPPRLLDSLPPQYDWRELRRWKINQSLLPPGSTVLFRQPSVWQQHWALITVGGSVVLLQGLLIFTLLASLIQRRRAEGSLAESERRFRSMGDAAPVLIWMAGTDKLCTYFNKAWLAFTGRNMEQEMGTGWSESVHPDDFQKCLNTYVTAFDARKDFNMQYRLRRADGEYRWITDCGVPRYGRGDRFAGYVGACVDITDSLEQRKELNKIEERIALATEAAHLGVWELDVETNELWISDEIRKLYQYEPNQKVTYEDFRNRVHPEDDSSREQAMQHAIKLLGSYEYEFRIVLPDGSIRWIAGRSRCVPRSDGKPKRVLSVSLDVTNRKQAENLFRLATEAAPSGMVLINSNAEIVLVNVHVEELFGYNRDEMVGKEFELLVPERFTQLLAEECRHCLAASEAGGNNAGRELIGRRKDGSEFPIEIGLNAMKTPQGVLFLATVVDQSARKAAEREANERRLQIELLSRVSLLGEMTAALAHELNQPLSAIVSNANAGIRFIDRGKADLEGIREILADMAADGLRAHEIIDNVRTTIKKGSTVRRSLSINDVVTRVGHLLRPDAVAHSCQVRLDLGEGLPSVVCDPLQIEQVLTNLIRNAFDAMAVAPPENRIVEVSTGLNGEGVEVHVRDHGAGIADDAQARLFEQFFTTKETGLGMGLAIVRSVLEAHGGTINAANVPDGGACFHVTLPASNGNGTNEHA